MRIINGSFTMTVSNIFYDTFLALFIDMYDCACFYFSYTLNSMDSMFYLVNNVSTTLIKNSEKVKVYYLASKAWMGSKTLKLGQQLISSRDLIG